MDALHLMDQLRDRDIMLTGNGSQLRFLGPPGSVTPDLLAAMRAQKSQLLALLREQVQDGEIDPERAGWDPETADLIRWFRQCQDLPTEPFELSPGVKITDPACWFRALHGVIAVGPAGPEAQAGQLRLQHLREVVEQRRRVQPITAAPQTGIDAAETAQPVAGDAAAAGVGDENSAFQIEQLEGYQRITGEFWTAEQRQMNSLHYAVSYRASFKPELPDYCIRRYCDDPERDVIFDPFSGRGTTVLQANLLGFRGIANDVNPLSERIAVPKTRPVPLQQIAARLEVIDLEAAVDDSDFEAFSMFYDRRTYRELLNLRAYLRDRRDDVDRFIEMIALSRLHGHSKGFFSAYSFPQIAVPPARQSAINRKRNQTPEYRPIKPRILEKAKAALKDLTAEQIQRLLAVSAGNLFTTRDARHIPELADQSVALVVTSPPFLDKADYLVDNWLEFWFLGIDPEPLKGQLVQTPRLDEWSAFIGGSLREMHRLLRPGGTAVIEVGEVVHRGRRLNLDEIVAEQGGSAGFQIREVLINQQQFTKLANCFNVTNNEKGTNTNRLVVLGKA